MGLKVEELGRHWQVDSQPYLLLDEISLKELGFEKMRRLGSAGGLTLVTPQPAHE